MERCRYWKDEEVVAFRPSFVSLRNQKIPYKKLESLNQQKEQRTKQRNQSKRCVIQKRKLEEKTTFTAGRTTHNRNEAKLTRGNSHHHRLKSTPLLDRKDPLSLQNCCPATKLHHLVPTISAEPSPLFGDWDLCYSLGDWNLIITWSSSTRKSTEAPDNHRFPAIKAWTSRHHRRSGCCCTKRLILIRRLGAITFDPKKS